MKIMLATVAVSIGMLAGSATADLTGTDLDLELVQTGILGDIVGPSGGTHTYGTTDTFIPITSPMTTWDVTSPGGHPAYDNSLLLDFTNFEYALFAVPFGSTSTLDAWNIAEDVLVGSAAVFLPGDLSTDIALFSVESGGSFTISWDVQTVCDANPVNPAVIVAWNSIPAPGAVARLGLAGLFPSSRRRRR